MVGWHCVAVPRELRIVRQKCRGVIDGFSARSRSI
jgi:hypothetical protein